MMLFSSFNRGEDDRIDSLKLFAIKWLGYFGRCLVPGKEMQCLMQIKEITTSYIKSHTEALLQASSLKMALP